MKKLTAIITGLLLIMASALPAAAQKALVKGTVSDPDGQPVTGALVCQEGTPGNYSTTDLNGHYELSVPAGAALKVICMGFKEQIAEIGGRSVVDIILALDTSILDESVVVGYGRVKKSDLTGSIASVKTEQLINTPSNSVEGLLQGRVAGVQVINASQDPGSGSTVRIRGNSSLNGSNAPLVVVDGFPYGDAGNLSQINPADIISMEVLKDASASAIYGSRGANGVILITTRKAGKNVTRVSVRQQTTVSQTTSELDIWRDPVLMAICANEGNVNGGIAPKYIGETDANGVYYPSINELLTTWDSYTEWDKLVLREAPISDNTTVTVQSTNAGTFFTLSANYFKDNGIYIEDDYTKYGCNFAVEHKVWDFLKLKASANITQNRRHNNNGLAYNRNPIFPVYDENGEYFLYSNQDYYHPLALTEFQKNDKTGTGLLSYVGFDFTPTSWLTVTGQLNYRHNESIQDIYYPKKYSLRGTNNNGMGVISNAKDDNLVGEIFANVDKSFGKHHLGAMIGYSFETYESRSSELAGVDFVNESLGNQNLAAGNAEKYQISNGLSATRMISGMARFNYSWDDRFLATATFRTDGSSKFGDNNKFAFFPSGAVSWKLHNEELLKGVRQLDQLKLRLSYGVSGNQGISPYQTLDRYGQHKYWYNGGWQTVIGPGYVSGYTGQSGIYKLWSGISNKSLKWESTAQLDAGVDLSMFGNRFNVTADWYVKRTTDLLRERNIAPSSGYDKMWVNDGEILNTGVELTVDGILYSDRDWKVGTSVVLSHNRNRVVSLGNSIEAGLNKDPNTGMEFEFYGNQLEQFRGYPNILGIGQPMYAFYGYKVDGMVQSLGDGLSSGLMGDDAEPGEFRYVDLNRDGTIDEDDRCIIGDPNPDLTASLGFDINWKRLDFNVFLYGVFGNDVLNTKRFGNPSNNPLRWTPDNPTDYYPRLNATRQTRMSDWWIEDGSFVRVGNLTLGYTQPLSRTDSGRKIRFYVNASNLYTFTAFKGYDPEVGLNGIYSGGYPRLRKWTIGIDFNF